MSLKRLGLLALAASVMATGAFTLKAQAEEMFVPNFVYRTGPYAPNGIPFANGASDFIEMLNKRDGGLEGVKILYEECETGYATKAIVECYERLKNKNGGVRFCSSEQHRGDLPVDPQISCRQGRRPFDGLWHDRRC